MIYNFSEYSPILFWNGIDWVKPEVDRATNVLSIIEYEHHEIHGGSHYLMSHSITLSGLNHPYFIQTPNTTRWCHIVMAYGMYNAGQLTLKEGGVLTSTVGATTLTAINRDRNSTNVSTIAIYSSAIGTGGSAIFSEMWGSGKNAVFERRGASEIILKQNTLYQIIVGNSGVGDSRFQLLLDWYEHTNRA